ncbi:hypothetical protein [Kutzneria sp. NPDC052558]|uniref:hypothetical protein n=1 Tax=Kutzneria sp. NPDC052558 TaxID=3364121 RepID=UPI0037C509E8
MAFLDDDATSGGLSAEQIVDKMKGAAANGTPTLDAASSAATQVQGIHAEIEGHVGGVLSKLMDAWKGDAAQYAQDNITPLQAVLQKSQDDLGHAQNISSRQSGSFHDATHSLVPVPAKPSNNLLNVMTPWHTDLDDKINQWNDAQSKNIAVYNSYTSASNYNHDNMPTTYGDVSNSSTPTNVQITQTPSAPPNPGPGPGTGGYGPGHSGGYTQYGTYSGVGGSSGPNTPNYGGANSGGQPGGGPVGGGYSGPGSSTGTQGWPGSGAPGQGPGYGNPGYGQPGYGSQSPFGPGGSADAAAFGGGALGGGFGGGGYGGSSAGGGSGTARGFSGSGSAGGGSAQGAGNRAGAGGVAGESGPGAASVVGRPGAAGAAGAGGMGAGGRGGKKEEDTEHKTAAYLEDDYSDDIVGELPRTVPPVIGMD